MKSITLALRIWFLTSIVFGLGWLIYTFINHELPVLSFLLAILVSLVGSLPVLILLIISLPIINKKTISYKQKKINLLLVCFTASFIYGSFAYIVFGFFDDLPALQIIAIAIVLLMTCAFISIAFSSRQISLFFVQTNQLTSNNYKIMAPTTIPEMNENYSKPTQSNKILYKAGITGVLILVMLIPTLFLTNLVHERQTRKETVADEVSGKWAQSQTLTGPYIYLPYKIITTDRDKKLSEVLSHLIIIPDNLLVDGTITHEIRLRSIYKVLLYKAALKNSGDFQFRLPKEIDRALIQWQDAKICYGISDFKGIEERLIVNFKDTVYELSPGLPTNDLNEKGLSAPIPLAISDEGQKLQFNINLKIKGSEKLHFVPLSGDSRFTLRSTWASPSFDGGTLPSVRTVSDSGFTAMWTFNKANLPFGTVLNDFKYDQESLAFGVTMIQTADGYAKTNRCIKYAILFIGLTFSLFFIIEIMQKKAVHPVQYILIGLALIIFYTLLLSLSEFVLFDFSYLIAAVATISLISFYAYGHFKSGKTAAIFSAVLSLLYGFTFILIRLEDTALLIGSIGLFIILAIAMYFSRKINWYGVEGVSVTA